MLKYIYKNKEYFDLYSLRKEITTIFPKNPDDILLKSLGIQILEYEPEISSEQLLNQAKQERAEAVSKIVVEVDGMKFDGDETSQNRMARTIAGAIANELDMATTQTWVLADNTVAQPTVAQLAQALQLAGEEQTKLWTIPYEETKETSSLARVGI